MENAKKLAADQAAHEEAVRQELQDARRPKDAKGEWKKWWREFGEAYKRWSETDLAAKDFVNAMSLQLERIAKRCLNDKLQKCTEQFRAYDGKFLTPEVELLGEVLLWLCELRDTNEIDFAAKLSELRPGQRPRLPNADLVGALIERGEFPKRCLICKQPIPVRLLEDEHCGSCESVNPSDKLGKHSEALVEIQDDAEALTSMEDETTGDGTKGEPVGDQKTPPSNQWSRFTIEKVDEITPGLDSKSADWVAGRKINCEKFPFKMRTIRDYRSRKFGGRFSANETFGIDRTGLRWRRRDKGKGTVYYFSVDLNQTAD